MKTPCEDCLCIARCRHKYYFELYSQCSLVDKFLFRTEGVNYKKLRHIECAKTLEKVLEPNKWRVRKARGREFVDTYDEEASSSW
jgi:hypothetical protein